MSQGEFQIINMLPNPNGISITYTVYIKAV